MLGLVHALLESGLELVADVASQVSPFEFDHQVVTATADTVASAGRASARA